MGTSLLYTIQKAPRWLHGIILGIISALLCYVDRKTGGDIAFDLFYLFPISYAAWLLPRGFTAITVFLCAIAWSYGSYPEMHHECSRIILAWNSFGHLMIFTIVGFFVVRIKRSLENLEQLALLDPLTQIANRRGFSAALSREHDRNLRYGSPFTIAYIDIDEFKQVNDRHGHDAGDRLLADVSAILKNNTRSTDTPARWGGDEFVLLLPETDAVHARTMINTVKQRLDTGSEIVRYTVTFSIGVVTFTHTPEIETILKKVDEVMFRVKKDVKNNIYYEEFSASENSLPFKQKTLKGRDIPTDQ
jgi:diguanylate cyclase (GGDEF)-like protein